MNKSVCYIVCQDDYNDYNLKVFLSKERAEEYISSCVGDSKLNPYWIEEIELDKD